jgi:hypothetical protein
MFLKLAGILCPEDEEVANGLLMSAKSCNKGLQIRDSGLVI